jgi:hypothetical protein
VKRGKAGKIEEKIRGLEEFCISWEKTWSKSEVSVWSVARVA